MARQRAPAGEPDGAAGNHCPGPILDIPALPLEYTADASAPAELLPGGTLAERMDAYEAQIIRDSYQRCGTTVAVARELGISQATAARKIAKYVTARA